MGTKEAAEKWGYAPATIARLGREGLIDDVNQDSKSSPWHIPKDAECPKKIKAKGE